MTTTTNERIHNRYPPKIYLLMLDIACENSIPIKRVETVFLQKIFTDMGLLNCPHIRMGIRPSDKKPHCKDCWEIFIQLKPARYDSNGKLVEAGQYVREPTFLDKDKDNGENQEILKLAGPPRKKPRFKNVNVPSGRDY